MKKTILLFLTILLSTQVYAGEITVDENYFYDDGEKFLVKGVVYVPMYPGDLPWEMANRDTLSKEYRTALARDFKDIEALGVNTVRFWDVSPDVYRVFKDAVVDMHLIQTIWLDSAQKDYQDPGFKKRCKAEIRKVLGRLYAAYESEKPPVLAYVVGSELRRDRVIETDQAHPEITGYDGEFVSAPEGSTPTESFIAEMADYLKKYELETYGYSHLVTYANEARTYDILNTPFLDFRSYNTYSYAILDFASPENGSVNDSLFQGWIESLRNQTPEKPMLITETGLSISPEGVSYGAPEYGYGGNTEEEQAEFFQFAWSDVVTANQPIAGMVVHEYLDAWWKFGKADSLQQEPDDVEEWFGLVSMKKTETFFETEKRPSYFTLQELWGSQSEAQKH